MKHQFLDNIMLTVDSYKHSHHKQYPPGTEYVRSYYESREGAKFDNTVFFGLQYYIEQYLDGHVVTKEKIDEAEEVVTAHMGHHFNRAGWEHILNHHKGRLPVEIKAVPEGMLVPTSNVMMTVENTDPQCYWLTNFLETLLVNVWYPNVVATQSYEMRRIVEHYLDLTGDDTADFKVHDFGVRGVSCPEQAAIGGAAHLVNFQGTDNLPAVQLLRKFYGHNMAGFSIPASEHSTITSWGKEHEVDAMRNMLEQYPDGLVACVSDSFNIWTACEKLWGETLKDKVLARDGVLVVRPDSGVPHITVLKVLEILWKQFGGQVNSKGYRVLDPHVRIIQGDGIDLDELKKILFQMSIHQWSADNIAFGSGGGLLQKVNRDTQRNAFKCSQVVVNGEERGVYKDPITDLGKVSKQGRLKLVYDEFGKLSTVPYDAAGIDILQTVFFNGIHKVTTFDKVRAEAWPILETENVCP